MNGFTLLALKIIRGLLQCRIVRAFQGYTTLDNFAVRIAYPPLGQLFACDAVYSRRDHMASTFGSLAK